MARNYSWATFRTTLGLYLNSLQCHDCCARTTIPRWKLQVAGFLHSPGDLRKAGVGVQLGRLVPGHSPGFIQR